MPNKIYSFTVNGKDYDIPWDKPSKPTKWDVAEYIDNLEQPKKKGTLEKAWDFANTPLTDLPSRAARAITTPARQFYTDHPSPMSGGMAAADAVDFAGDTVSSMTSPGSLGLAALTAGSSLAANAGKAGLATALSAPGRAAAVGMMGHGAYRVATEPTTAGKVGGGLESAMGYLGRGGPEVAETPIAEAGPRNFGRVIPERATPVAPQRLLNGRVAPIEPGPGEVRPMGPSPLDPNVPINGEVLPQRQIGGISNGQLALPPMQDKALPPIGNTYYGGQGGVALNDIEGAATPQRTFTGGRGLIPVDRAPVRNWSDARARLQSTEPGLQQITAPPVQSVAPVRDVLEQNSPYGASYINPAKAPQMQSSLPDMPVVAAEKAPVLKSKPEAVQPKGYEDVTKRPMAKVSDRDIEFLTRTGDKVAIEEAKRRPTLNDFLKKYLGNEEGSIDIPGFLGRGKEKAENPHLGPFSDWVNNIKSSKVEGQLKAREFKDLDSEGFNGITRLQAGDTSGRFGDVRNYLDSKFAELKKAGIPLDYRENYLTQIWKDSPQKVGEVYRRLGLKPSMSINRVFDTYEQGKAAGLTPRFDKVSDIVGYYEQRANKAIADRKYFDYLKENGVIRPLGKGDADWKQLDPNHFPGTAIKGKDDTLRIVPQTAPPELHKLISNYLANPNEQLQWMADKASLSKNFAMSSGVPLTGINAHGANIMARTLIGNPKEAWTNAKYIFKPSEGMKYLDENLHRAPEMVKAGLTLTTEGHELGTSGSTNLAGQAMQKFLGAQGKYFEDPLFQKIIPALKLKHSLDMTADLEKSGMTRPLAAKRAAEFTNNLYGGINWEAMGRNRDVQNVLRAAILAPDWAESNIRLGKGVATNFDRKEYKQLVAGLIGSYIAADVVNQSQNDGKHMWENSPGHALDIRVGSSDNKERYIRPFGTAADFARLPYEMVTSAMQGDPGNAIDIAKNRMSIPGRVAGDFIWNQGSNGLPIRGKDAYGRKIPIVESNPKINRGQTQLVGAASELSKLIMPPYVKSMIDYNSGASNPEQALLGSAEMPVRYSTKPRQRGRRGF